jgi:hypothetical protein
VEDDIYKYVDRGRERQKERDFRERERERERELKRLLVCLLLHQRDI